jgi:hypothetical protein
MLILTISYVIKSTLGATDFMIIIGGWLGYAGFNTIQINVRC